MQKPSLFDFASYRNEYVGESSLHSKTEVNNCQLSGVDAYELIDDLLVHPETEVNSFQLSGVDAFEWIHGFSVQSETEVNSFQLSGVIAYELIDDLLVHSETEVDMIKSIGVKASNLAGLLSFIDGASTAAHSVGRSVPMADMQSAVDGQSVGAVKARIATRFNTSHRRLQTLHGAKSMQGEERVSP